MSKSNDKLDSNIELDKSELSAVVGDEDELEVLGRAMMYTVGDVVVPREWLLERAEALGIPDRLLPTETTPHSAFKRSLDRLTNDGWDAEWVRAGTKDVRVEYRVKKSDGKARHLIADVHYDEDDINVDGGKWEHHDLGSYHYDTEHQGLRSRQDESCPLILEEKWEAFHNRAHTLFQEEQRSHNGNDIRNIAYSLRYKWTDTIVPLRDAGAVYFVPEGDLTSIMESIATLYDEINEEYKSSGKDVEIRTIEVVDSEEKREWVEHRVQKNLESVVDSAFSEAWDSLKEDDETIEEIVESVADNLGAAENTATNYNDLLQSRLSVEQVLQRKLGEVDGDEKEDVIQRVLNENGVGT